MIKKIGIAVLLGTFALGLAACGQQSDKTQKEGTTASQPSMTDKVKQAGDTAAQKVKEAGQSAADALNKAKKSIQDTMGGSDTSTPAAPTTPAAPAPAAPATGDSQ